MNPMTDPKITNDISLEDRCCLNNSSFTHPIPFWQFVRVSTIIFRHFRSFSEIRMPLRLQRPDDHFLLVRISPVIFPQWNHFRPIYCFLNIFNQLKNILTNRFWSSDFSRIRFSHIIQKFQNRVGKSMYWSRHSNWKRDDEPEKHTWISWKREELNDQTSTTGDIWNWKDAFVEKSNVATRKQKKRATELDKH